MITTIRLKRARLTRLETQPDFRVLLLDLADPGKMERLFGAHQFDQVVNLAAQAGVRHSMSNPHAYINSNIVGFLNVLEGCRHLRTLWRTLRRLFYAPHVERAVDLDVANQSVQLSKMENGQPTVLRNVSVPLCALQTYSVKVQAKVQSHDVVLDGQPLLVVTDGTFFTGGVGLRVGEGNTAEFSNVRVIYEP